MSTLAYPCSSLGFTLKDVCSDVLFSKIRRETDRCDKCYNDLDSSNPLHEYRNAVRQVKLWFYVRINKVFVYSFLK